jgi:tetratricopeptide (TPR) repeat protein
MIPASRTPEGEPNCCPICGNAVRIEPSSESRDAPCPHCGSLLWFFSEYAEETPLADVSSVLQKAYEALRKKDAPQSLVQPRELPVPVVQAKPTARPALGADVADLILRVLVDPADIRYVRALLASLHAKYKDNRKGARFAGFRARRAKRHLHRAWLKQDLRAVVHNALEILRVNPWDIYALRSMASAANASGNGDCEFLYLRHALEAGPKDIDTNIQCANALAARGEFDKAVACWQRVEQLRPGDERAQQAISELTVRKSLKSGE